MLSLKKAIWGACLTMLTLTLENLSWGMENVSEKSKLLLNIQDSVSQPLITNSYIVQNPTSLPDDCWFSIFEDLSLTDNTHVSEICHYFYKILKMDQNIFSNFFHYFENVHQMKQLKMKYVFILPESERTLIQQLNQLVLENESFCQKLANELGLKKDIMLTLYSGNGSTFFKDAATLFIHQDDHVIIPLRQSTHDLLTHYTTINPSFISTPEVDILGQWAVPPVVTPPTTLRRTLRMFSRNIPLTIGLTVISVAAFGTGAYFLWNQYPDVEPIRQEAGQKALTAFLNQTHLEGSDYWGTGLPFDRVLPNFFNNCLRSYGGCQFYDVTPSPHYICDPSWKGSDVKTGNVTDWVNLVMSRCVCSFDFWYRYAGLLINGTPPNPHNMVCNLNPGSNSICCGNVWNFSAQKEGYGVNCFGNYCFRMIRGDGLKAQQAAEHLAFEETVTPWRIAIGIYLGIGGPASLLFFGMMIVSYCFC